MKVMMMMMAGIHMCHFARQHIRICTRVSTAQDPPSLANRICSSCDAAAAVQESLAGADLPRLSAVVPLSTTPASPPGADEPSSMTSRVTSSLPVSRPCSDDALLPSTAPVLLLPPIGRPSAFWTRLRMLFSVSGFTL